MTKYYALWYYSYCDGARGAFAISEHPEMLISMHEENIKNPESQWYNSFELRSTELGSFPSLTSFVTENIPNYDEKLYEMKVAPIECYTYNSETKKIEPYNDKHKTDGYDFYAFNTLCNNDSFGFSFYDDIVMKVADTGGNFLDNDDFDDWNKGEILIYLSKSCHKLWQECSDLYQTHSEAKLPAELVVEGYKERKPSDQKCENKEKFNEYPDSDLPTFFYTNWPSHSPVEPNVYYEDGVMNA